MRLSDSQIADLVALAKPYEIEVAALAAIIAVESNGIIFAPETKLPVIRWEGHYFYRFLKGAKRDKAIAAKLASPTAGAIKNPTSQSARYDLLSRAAGIDKDAAYSSISMGVGQVMGSHWKTLGFASPYSMFTRACSGFKGQVEVMLKFIEENSLVDEIQRRDWSAFARAYNGPAYQKNKYHTKMAAAYAEAIADPRIAERNVENNSKGSASSMLRLGSKGARVREVQQLLVRAGSVLSVDGDFGPATRDAVKSFQTIHGLEADGVVGPKTMETLATYRSSIEEKVGQPALITLPETTTGGAGTIGGVGTAVAADKINEIAEKLGGAEGIFNHISNGLYTISAVLVVGGIIWAGYGWLKSRRTYEGVTA
ncbi:N-acetylmuramidase domain-containing protein [Ochrobactrum sp. WV_118_8]